MYFFLKSDYFNIFSWTCYIEIDTETDTAVHWCDCQCQVVYNWMVFEVTEYLTWIVWIIVLMCCVCLSKGWIHSLGDLMPMRMCLSWLSDILHWPLPLLSFPLFWITITVDFMVSTECFFLIWKIGINLDFSSCSLW